MGLSGTALYPYASLAVTRVWLFFGPSSTQLLEGVGYAESAGGEVWRPGCSKPNCETVGQSLLSGPLPPYLGGGIMKPASQD